MKRKEWTAEELRGLDMADVEKEATRIVEQIRPLLGGHPPPLQGMVIAELMAIWLAGHDPAMRPALRKLQDATTDDMLPLWVEALHGKRDA